MRGKLAVSLLLCGVLLVSCAKHKFEAEWEAWNDDCVAEGILERAEIGSLDEEGADLVKDTCSEVVAEMSQQYQDVPPNEILESEMDATFERIFKDCLNQDFLESDYC